MENCESCLNKKMRINSLEARNKYLKSRIDEFENITLFSWITWFLFGERMQLRRPLNEFDAD